MLPPHLPPPTCNIKHYREWQRVKILLAAAVFGLAAGLSGASMMIGWIWPGLGGGDVWVTSQRLSAASRNQLAQRVAVEATERIASVYAGEEINRGVKFLPQKNFLGQAVMMSSDGWLALYLPRPAGNYRNWQVVLSDGAVYGVDKMLPDKITGLAFLHLAPSADKPDATTHFNVAALADKLETAADLYVFDGQNWQWTTKVSDLNVAEIYPHLDSAPLSRARIDFDSALGQAVINAQGRLAGFVVGERTVLPFQYIAQLLPGVLNDQKIIYPTLGVEGWYSAQQPVVVGSSKVAGFFVTKSAGALRAGDIILEFNGQVADSDKIWYNVKAGEIVKLKVARAGKILDLEATILEKKF